MNRLLLRAPTALWSAVERCLVLLVVGTVLVAMASSALAAEGAVVTVDGRVRALVQAESCSCQPVSATGSRPVPIGFDSPDLSWARLATEAPPGVSEFIARQPRLSGPAPAASPDALGRATSITQIAPSTWGSARARVGGPSRMKPAAQTPKPE